MFWIIFAAYVVSLVSGEACSADDITSWSQPDFGARVLKFSTRKSTMKNLVLRSLKRKPVDWSVNKLMPKAVLDMQLSPSCSACYVLNIICTYDNCARVCAGNPLDSECRACNVLHCMPSLLECVGPEAAQNMPAEPTDADLPAPAELSDDEN